MEQAKSENLIVCLPTGSGKTFIVVMLIKEWLPDIRPSLTDGGKRTILLVNTGIIKLNLLCIRFILFSKLNLPDNTMKR
jgi:endoribonuclease Dicer